MVSRSGTAGDVQALVATEYWRLADLLEGLADTDWDTPSLCQGWRVREVVAHMTMPVRYDEQAFVSELRARDFDFGRLSNEIAWRDAQTPVGELLRELRSDVLNHWVPPGGRYLGALDHVVIHGLDLTVPLGRQRLATDEATRLVLDDLTRGGTYEHFGTHIAGTRFEASDLSWSYGSGPTLRAEAGQLALVLCGRAISSDLLAGGTLKSEGPYTQTVISSDHR